MAATPLREGVHIRGRDSSLTLEGSRALPALWGLLAARLGADPQAAERPEASDPKIGAALATLTDRLREHDLLVEHPDGVELPPWLGAVAGRPSEAAEAIRAAHPVVRAADPGGTLARAVDRALTEAGAVPSFAADDSLPAGRALLTTGSPETAVAVAADAGGGFVTAPAHPVRARSDAEEIAARLAAAPDTAAPDTATPDASAALTALLAGAAAQRLLRAVAGLPDPAAPDRDPRLLAGRPAILVARARPLRADHHPWAAGPPLPGHPATAPAPEDLAEALRRIAALGDQRLGVLDEPLPGSLPQVPAALVSCRTPAGPLLAGAARTDLARLDAACRSAELHLGAGPFTSGAGATPVVGATPEQARGLALRRAALALPVGGASPIDTSWRDHPQVRHWWTTLTERLDVKASLTVNQLDADEPVFRVDLQAPGLAVSTVEATPADAVAFAALAAVAQVTAHQHGLSADVHTTPSGAAAPLATAGVRPAAWEDEGWTNRWLTGIADREPALQHALHRLTGLHTTPWQSARPEPHPVAAALAGCGFTVLATARGETR
ncbi:hypothetical protein F7Q99_32760 [Streptomyces kaniharaensis]|uniref:YcaO domain-containing protein n=1 Tax=Streptomyces kaniharaensis TaxID=212423 RepID=A0A6N7L4N0_9ACTN|nr:hypothetical protein [Streptomyces kaniharaensis]MQS16833.1 hypothetical protein [Streptomyces kaniharaensis]